MKQEFFKLFNIPSGKYEPHAKQRLVHDGIEKYRNVYFLAGRQSGKTLLAAMEAAYALLIPHTDGQPAEISLVSDKLRFAENVFELVEYIYTNTPDLKKRVRKINHSASKMELTLKNGAILRCKSSHIPTTLAGDTVSLLITDESGFISDRAMSLVRPTMAVREGKHLAIGTADVESEWFREAYQSFKDEGLRFAKKETPTGDSVAFHAASTDNPYFSKEELERIKQKETIRNFRLLYLAEFSGADNQVFAPELLESVFTLPIPKKGARGKFLMPSTEGRRFVAGVDIGRHVDFTVITILDVSTYPAELVHIERFNQKTPEAIAKTVASTLSKFDALGYIDSTGIGDVYYAMIKKYYHNIRPFTFTATSKNPLVEGLVVKLEQQDIALYPDSDLKQEMESFIVKKTATGHIQYVGTKHDDCVLSLALAAMGVRTSYDLKRPSIRVL